MIEEPSLVGTMVGSYRITGELSRGGMGAVYRAEHSVLERTVAVKVLRPELTSNDELLVRFVNEAKAASAINHPGIIEILDYGHAQDGRAYFVMEMLEGESLARRIESRGRLPEREAIDIARGIASALAAAHGKGIFHRDLKPDNVFLIPDPDLGERPKVLDFGIAKLELGPEQTKYTQTGALIGTPMYMAPEQARAASAIDHRADLYSLGCMLYEMLVGEPPFVAVGAGEIIALQMFQPPTAPSERVPGISPAVDAIVMRLLAKEPEDRFQSAGELGHALGGAQREGVGSTAPPPFGGGAPRPASIVTTQHATPARRGLAMTAGLIAAGLVAIAIVAAVLLRGDDATPPAKAERAPDPSPTVVPAKPAEPPATPVEQVPVEVAPTEVKPVEVKAVETKPRPRAEKTVGHRPAGSGSNADVKPVTRNQSPYENAP